MVELLVAIVGKLTDEVVHLGSDNVELKKQSRVLKGLVAGLV
jgi:hypothetical protein